MAAHTFAYLLSQKSFKLHLTLINHCFIFKGKIKSVIDVVLRLSSSSHIRFSLSFVVLSFFYCKEIKACVKVMSRRGFRTSLNAMRPLPQICPRIGGAGNTRSFPSFLF